LERSLGNQNVEEPAVQRLSDPLEGAEPQRTFDLGSLDLPNAYRTNPDELRELPSAQTKRLA
jgi:hypothetical protein